MHVSESDPYQLTRVLTAWFYPKFKIGVYPGRFDRDNGNSQTWRVFYDPDIEANRLTVPLEDAYNFIEPLNRLPGVDYRSPIPFSSSKRFQIFEFDFFYRSEENGDKPFVLSPDVIFLKNSTEFQEGMPSDLVTVPLGPMMLSFAVQVFGTFEPVGILSPATRSMSLWLSQAILSRLTGEAAASNGSRPSALEGPFVLIAKRQIAPEKVHL